MTVTPMTDRRLIETDEFPFEFLSRLAERESWRKEVHRPIYHIHKWWAKRLGSVFRGILLGSILPKQGDLQQEFYRTHAFSGRSVFDPFMGSGTTIGEAHKLGFAALGRDINPVAVEAVESAFGPLDRRKLLAGMEELSETVGQRIRSLYRSKDSRGRACDVLYYFWVMQADCPECHHAVDLFPSYVVARNAYPDRKPKIQILCPSCGGIFEGVNGTAHVECAKCSHEFDATSGPAVKAKCNCPHCRNQFTIIDAVARRHRRPDFRLYSKLVLACNGSKEYLPATPDDLAAYAECSDVLNDEIRSGRIRLPDLRLEHGYNTRQAMNYGFTSWRDFFNDRHLLALGWLRSGIEQLPDASVRKALMTLFSGVLEFNNLFASYKGEGTGAVRHMFSHHILKPERTPIEAHVWGTPKSSGSFTNLFRSRLLRAIDYREAPTEVNGESGPGRVCSAEFAGNVETEWPSHACFADRAVYLSCGDSSATGLPARSVDLVVTDPPFFDNVHYSELADFFYSWQCLNHGQNDSTAPTTRHSGEVQDSDSDRFAMKLKAVLLECRRVLKDDGLLVFTYHHSREEGWRALADAVLGAGFVIANAHPVKAEMSVATPKSQAKEPIQLDIVLVCRKRDPRIRDEAAPLDTAIATAKAKLQRLSQQGFTLSLNDRKITFYGQALTAISDPAELPLVASRVDAEVLSFEFEPPSPRRKSRQSLLFEELNP